MQGAASGRKKRIRYSSILWMLAGVLVVMVSTTLAVAAGTYLTRYSDVEDCVISLDRGYVSLGEGSLSRASAGITGTASQTSAKTAKASDFKVSDDSKLWSTDTKVDIFHVSYKGGTGEITVESGDTDKVIAPGTDGKFDFTLKNTGSRPADYKVWVETDWNGGELSLPVMTRMHGSKGWLAGDEDTWGDASAIDGAAETSKLEAGRSAGYSIYWQWPFESGDDGYDTLLGDTAADRDLEYTITIHTLATATDEAPAPDTNGNGSKTGDDSHMLVWVIVLAAAAVCLVVLLAAGRRKKDEDEEDRRQE